MKKRIVAFILAISMFMGFATPASAAGGEEFLSEVSLVYADSVDEAKKKIKNTEWKLYEQDLNANADYMLDDGVYLIYKTSKNVEDAITDLRVMDMYGGYNISDYKRQLEKSKEDYLGMVEAIRIAATEFKALYEAGDEMAKLAYRQMNFYKDTKVSETSPETDLLMGDFMLNIPSDEALVRVLFEGNAIVTANLINLLAVGLSGTAERSLSIRIAECYEVKETLTPEKYHEKAVLLSESFEELRAKILRYDSLKPEYDIDQETLSEEEFVFVFEYASLAELITQIKIGDINLADLLREGDWTIEALYPIVAALSDGQNALISVGQLETVLKYNAPSKPIDELTKAVDEAEKKLLDENGKIVPADVYIGVDRSIFQGAYAMTNAAERQQALTGETWDLGEAAYDSLAFLIVGAVVDVAMWSVFIHSVITDFPYTVYFEYADSPSVFQACSWVYMDNTFPDAFLWNQTGVIFWISFGVTMVMAGMQGISMWYNYYNPDYTEIPNTMVDVRETDIGDKYIKYTAAKVFGEEKKNADFNAYEGKEWIALYYTKDATAGNCLTPNFEFSTNNSIVARRHQGISMFGEEDAFNLNSHVYNDDAKGAYVTVRYSTQKKAAADLPDVVGSTIGDGVYYILSAFGGFGIGLGLMGFIGRGKKKKNDEALTNEASSEE